MEKEILSNLNTKWLGKNLIYYNSIDSTQKEAHRLMEKEKKLKNGTVIITEKQTDGIGTHGRKWYSGTEGNIFFTVVLYPNCYIKKIEGFTIRIVECLIETIKCNCDISLQIKNPNDLVYYGKKVGGILTQTTTSNEIVKQMIIGIGINVNEIEFPKELEDIAISLKMIKGKEISKELIIADFLNLFEDLYEKIIL